MAIENDTTLDGIGKILDALLAPGMEFMLVTIDPKGEYRYKSNTHNVRAHKTLKAVVGKLERKLGVPAE